MKSTISRRSLLRLAGSAPLAAWAVPWLHARPALGAVTPPRLLVYWTSNGTIIPAWKPTISGTTMSFAPGSILEPLAKYRDKALILGGVNMASPRKKDANGVQAPGSQHSMGVGCALTGGQLNPGSFKGGGGVTFGWPNSISVDQHLAKTLPLTTRLRSLELGVGNAGNTTAYKISYYGSNQPAPVEIDPVKVYERVFANLMVGTPSAAVTRQLEDRKSVLDHVRKEIEVFRGKIGGEERERLDRHLSSLRDIETQLVQPAANCTLPGRPAVLSPTDGSNHPALLKSQIDLAAAALSCNQTRIVTLMTHNGTSQRTFPSIGVSGAHHGLSHLPDTDTAAQNSLIKINRYYATQLAYLLDRLAAMPDSNGGTVLDNTVVLWANELGKGNNHSMLNVPYALFGGANYFKMGRYVQFTNKPHNDLLVSICHAMGLLDQKTFGDPDYSTGPLPGLTTA